MDNKTTKEKSEFPKLLENAINSCSIENASNTADYILTEFLLSCLNAYEVAVIRRDRHNNSKEQQPQKEQQPNVFDESYIDEVVEKVSDGYFVKKQKKSTKIATSSANILG
jgi:hypothetical protein